MVPFFEHYLILNPHITIIDSAILTGRMSETPPPKKKRKSLPSAVLRQTPLLQEAERSLLTEEDVGWSSEEMRGRELWLVQLPIDVCLPIQKLPIFNSY